MEPEGLFAPVNKTLIIICTIKHTCFGLLCESIWKECNLYFKSCVSRTFRLEYGMCKKKGGARSDTIHKSIFTRMRFKLNNGAQALKPFASSLEGGTGTQPPINPISSLWPGDFLVCFLPCLCRKHQKDRRDKFHKHFLHVCASS